MLARYAAAASDALVAPMAPALPVEAFRHLDWLASEKQGAITFFARSVLFLAATCLRFAHAQRFRFDPAECSARTLVGAVFRGKVRQGAAFRVAAPAFIRADFSLPSNSSRSTGFGCQSLPSWSLTSRCPVGRVCRRRARCWRSPCATARYAASFVSF